MSHVVYHPTTIRFGVGTWELSEGNKGKVREGAEVPLCQPQLLGSTPLHSLRQVSEALDVSDIGQRPEDSRWESCAPIVTHN